LGGILERAVYSALSGSCLFDNQARSIGQDCARYSFAAFDRIFDCGFVDFPAYDLFFELQRYRIFIKNINRWRIVLNGKRKIRVFNFSDAGMFL